MTGDHPTDWALKYVKAQTLRDAADDMRQADGRYGAEWSAWLNRRADELEQR